MDACRNIGITIVGHSNPDGDCGIFIGIVKKGGAAALCGRIEPGDLILEVNDYDLEHMRNEDALARLKCEVAKGGLVHMLVGKYWDMSQWERGGGAPAKENVTQMESLYEVVSSVRSMSTASSKPLSSSSDVGSHEINFEESQRKCGGGGGVLRAIPEDNGVFNARQFHEATGMSSTDLERLYDLSKAARKFGFGGGQAQSHQHQQQHQPQQQQSSSSSHMSSVSSLLRGATPYPDSGYYDGRCVNNNKGGSSHSLPQHSLTQAQDRRQRVAAGGGVIDAGNARGGAAISMNVLDASSSPFCGVDLVDWIQAQVAGLRGRVDAVSYAQNLLQTGHICNTDARQGGVFQEHNYYSFGGHSGCHSLKTSVDGTFQSKML